jgi:mono/diheme cytochrome c family protein/plastocyanin
MKREWIARIFLFLLLVAAGFIGALAVGPRLGLPGLTPAVDVELHARMPENGGWSVSEIQARVGQPLHLRLTSDDVMHSFAIGQSDQAPIDLLPGEWHDATLVFDKPGRYTFYCTRWCGSNHWRMRGTIVVTGSASAAANPTAEKPLYLRLGLDIDAAHTAQQTPRQAPSAERGAQWAERLPASLRSRDTYLTHSPAGLWLRLRAESSLNDRSDADLWDAVAYLWAQQTTPAALAEAKDLYAANCAACHGETGQGDGVMVEGLPRYEPGSRHASPSLGNGAMDGAAASDESTTGDMRLSAPPDFTDPRNLLGASPAQLEGKMLRGGMGTGMPYWGPIFTPTQMDALIAYLYTFAWKK